MPSLCKKDIIIVVLMFKFKDIPFFCRETCQGQELGTTSNPFIILFLELRTGVIAGIPQIFSEKQILQTQTLL